MDNNFSWHVSKKGDYTVLTITGTISEDSKFSDILNEPMNGHLRIDLAAIARTNSIGNREWTRFLSELSKKVDHITLDNCAICIVDQLNMIANFAGDATISSIYTPYFCPSCDHEHSELVELKLPDKPTVRKDLHCQKCDEILEFDNLPNSYFSFIDYIVRRRSLSAGA